MDFPPARQGRGRLAAIAAGSQSLSEISELAHVALDVQLGRCSRLAIAGASTMAIKELAGHQNISTTQRYMHLSPSAKSAAIDLLNGSGASSITTGPSSGITVVSSGK